MGRSDTDISWKSRASDPVYWGVIVSALFLILTAWLAQQTICRDGICQSRLSAFMASPANEIGDAFAGIAGTLALIWIVVTLVIQRMEISTTRRQSIHNEESLLAQKNYFQQEAVRQNITVLEGAIAGMLPNFDFQPSVIKLKDGDEIKLGFVGKTVTQEQFRGASSSEKLHMAAAVLKGVKPKIEKAISEGQISKAAAGRHWYEALCRQVEQLQAMSAEAPEDQKILLQRSRLGEHSAYLQFILGKDEIWRDEPGKP